MNTIVLNNMDALEWIESIIGVVVVVVIILLVIIFRGLKKKKGVKKEAHGKHAPQKKMRPPSIALLDNFRHRKPLGLGHGPDRVQADDVAQGGLALRVVGLVPGCGADGVWGGRREGGTSQSLRRPHTHAGLSNAATGLPAPQCGRLPAP